MWRLAIFSPSLDNVLTARGVCFRRYIFRSEEGLGTIFDSVIFTHFEGKMKSRPMHFILLSDSG